jgi:predicted phosphohydrolase
VKKCFLKKGIDMSIFAISDLHLSISVPEKSMTIFKGWDNYTQRLEGNWKSIVGNTDTVVVVGDISWAMRLEDTKKDFAFLDSLPGRKIILKGNHDYWWSSVKKINNFLAKNNFGSISILLNNAFPVENICVCGTRGWMTNSQLETDKKIFQREIGRLKTSIAAAERFGLKKTVFLHYPPVYGGEETVQILDILTENNIKKCYYGHVHGGKSNKRITPGVYRGIELQLVSCDYLDFRPILVE